MEQVTPTVILSVDSIFPNRKQSRTVFDPDKLQELANSIREQGVLQPILVREKGSGKFEIIAGERRFRACKMLGLQTIPGIVKVSDETDSMIDSFLENAQREDLSPQEKENALISLWRTEKFRTPRELDKALGYQSGYCGGIIEAREFREQHDIPSSITTSTIVSTRGLEDRVRRQLLLMVAKGEGKFGQVRSVRELKNVVERAPERLVEKILNESIAVDDAKKTVDLYEEATKKASLKPLASALAEGELSAVVAEKTMKLYDKLEQQGVSLDPSVVIADIEEVKRQDALDVAHQRLMEDARVAVLSGRKKSVGLRIQDDGGNFVREVTDVASKIQRWGIPNLMTAGAQRWKIAMKYFQDIDSKMHFLLGYGRPDSTEVNQN
jgi:hypothetical protein